MRERTLMTMTGPLFLMSCYNFRMKDFVLKDVNCDIESELEKIGFDKTYFAKAADKYRYKNIKILKLSVPQANILKQTAISVGADCAVHRETITGKVEFTDCILGGSFSQLKKIAQKLKKQPFSLSKLADLIENNLDFKFAPIKLKETVLDFSSPYLVGVVNLTQNSFSDGGDFYNFDDSIMQLNKLIEDGADIIELGAESTKPFSSAVCDEIQLEKLLPILKHIKENDIKTPISIDTRSSAVARACVLAGADIINDVSGGDCDKDMFKTIEELNVPIVIQHSKGTPENMQINPVYENLIDEIFCALREKIILAVDSGIKLQNIIVDPGIGFGKTKEQNFEIIKHIDEFSSLLCPVMLGVSRKSLIAVEDNSNESKDIYTLAINSRLLDKNVSFFRVHNVKLHRQLLALR